MKQFWQMLSRIGPEPLWLVADEQGLRLAEFAATAKRSTAALRQRFGADYRLNDGPCPVLERAAAALRAYTRGDARLLRRVPVHPRGTAFQQAVWRVLRSIPAGRTLSYGEVARRVGRPSAARAVGMACGANPIALFIPCHRVIGADNGLTGFGGGLARKARLLAHERAATAVPAPKRR